MRFFYKHLRAHEIPPEGSYCILVCLKVWDSLGLYLFTPDDEFVWFVVDVVAVGCAVFCAVEEVWLGASGYVDGVGEAPLS